MTNRLSAVRRMVSAVLSGTMVLAMVTFVPISAQAAAGGGITERDSVSTANVEGNGASGAPAITPDARFVAFESAANNLVVGDTNNATDVFVRDRQAPWSTERVSVDTAGVARVGASTHPSISADGRYVAFVSGSQLTSLATLGHLNVYVRDRTRNTTQLVSAGVGGVSADRDSFQPSISADGRYVAFASTATNLITAGTDTNDNSDVFVCTLSTGAINRVSVGAGSDVVSSAQYAGGSEQPSISGDGAHVVFRKQLDPSSPLSFYEIWVRDTVASSSTRLSIPALLNGDVNGSSYNPVISQDGAVVAFDTDADNIKGSEAKHGVIRVKLSDLTAQLVSQSTGGVPGNDVSEQPAISSNGRYVVFSSDATNFAADDGESSDIFVRDCTSATTVLQSVSPMGAQGDGDSILPAISGDGTFIAFESAAANLVASDTNGVGDVFARLIDSTRPVTTLQESPSPNAAGWWNSSVTVTLAATDTGSGVASTSYTLNGGSAQAYSAPFSANTEGTTNLGYYSSDAAGNVETAKSIPIKIDRTPPTTDYGPKTTTLPAPATITLTASDAVSGLKETNWMLDEQAGTGNVVSAIGVGNHKLEFASTDNAGNKEATHTVTFTLVAAPISSYNTSLRLSGPSSLKLRSNFGLRGTVTPAAAPGQIYMTFYLLKGSRWANYGRAKVGISAGTFAFNYKPPKRGKWRVYASYSRVDAGSAIYNKALTVRKDFTVK